MRETSINQRGTIERADLARIMAAHNPLSAMLVEGPGFDGIRASGLNFRQTTDCRM